MKINKKVLITGSTGVLGKKFLNKKKKNYSKVITLNRKDGNLLDQSFIEKFLNQNSPDIIIHCIADTNIERCEQDKRGTLMLHCGLTDYLSSFDSRFIYISTDAVIKPVNFYSKSKLLGEKISLINNERSIIVRCNMYGINSSSKNSLFEWAYANLKESIKIKGYSGIIFNAVYTEQIVQSVDKIIQTDFSGIINIGGNYSISKFEFLRKICKHFDFDTKLVSEEKLSNNDNIRRPLDTTLDTTVLNKEFGITLTLKDGFRQLRRDLYE